MALSAPEGAIPLLSSSPQQLSKDVSFLLFSLFICLSLSFSPAIATFPRAPLARSLARLLCLAFNVSFKADKHVGFRLRLSRKRCYSARYHRRCTPLFAFRSSVSTGRIGRFLSFSRSITRFPKSSLPLCPAIYVHFAEKIYMQSSSTAVCVCMCVHISEHIEIKCYRERCG